MSSPCIHCGCMLSDNLGCPEMSHCYDYHAWKNPKFIRSLDVLDPLVEEMICIRKEDNLNHVPKLIQKAYDEFYPPLVPAQTKYINEINKLLNMAQHDSETLHDNFERHMRRSMFDV
jgi:hypothetical protein